MRMTGAAAAIRVVDQLAATAAAAVVGVAVGRLLIDVGLSVTIVGPIGIALAVAGGSAFARLRGHPPTGLCSAAIGALAVYLLVTEILTLVLAGLVGSGS
jgi:hypothetical protein